MKKIVGLIVATIAIFVVSASVSAGGCTTVTTSKGHMTAAYIGSLNNGDLDAKDCQIGVYLNTDGSVADSKIYNATYYGVFVDGENENVSVDIKNNEIYNIGDVPFGGAQHGNAVYYYGFNTVGNVTGEVSGNIVYAYQKGGIVVNGEKASVGVNDNTVTGLGPFKWIAQNGIQFGFGAEALEVTGNTVSGNIYTQGGDPGWISTGILFYQGSLSGVESSQILPTVQKNNKVFRNQGNVTVIK